MAWIYVALGGAIGACSRYSLALLFANYGSRFPWATFVANGAGCFLMGLGFALIVEREFVNQDLRQLLLVGLLGALTTFSTFAIESLSLIQNQNYKLAIIYVAGSLLMSLCACFVGLGFGRMFVQ